MPPAARPTRRGLSGFLPPPPPATPDAETQAEPQAETRAPEATQVAAAATEQPPQTKKPSAASGAAGEQQAGDTSDDQPSKPAPARTPTVRPATTSAARGPRAAAEPEAGPKWTTLQRKDVRFRDDQLVDINLLTRRLKRARGRVAQGAEERLTDNTLVRVAVDFLLDHASDISGATEEELLASLRELTGTRARPSAR